MTRIEETLPVKYTANAVCVAADTVGRSASIRDRQPALGLRKLALKCPFGDSHGMPEVSDQGTDDGFLCLEAGICRTTRGFPQHQSQHRPNDVQKCCFGPVA